MSNDTANPTPPPGHRFLREGPHTPDSVQRGPPLAEAKLGIRQPKIGATSGQVYLEAGSYDSLK